MTVAVETPSVDYLEDGVTLAFPIPFTFGAAGDVKAYRSVAGVEAALPYGTAYTVAGSTLTLAATIAGATLSLRRETSRAQSADYIATGAFTADSHESALDRLARVDQEQDVEIARTLRTPRGVPGFTVSSVVAAALGSVSLLATALAAPLAAILPAVVKGDPGGNIMAVGLFTNLAGLTIPAGTDVIQSSGFHTLGKGIARYSRWTGAALPAAGQNIWWKVAANGSIWRIAETIPTSDQFGTFGDATRALGSQAVGGTDVTAIINELTYYAETEGVGEAILSRGGHRTSDTIHVGTGINGFCSVRLRGEVTRPWGTRHDSQTRFPSAEIKAEKNDRPAVNIASARSSGLFNVAVEGPLYAFITVNQLGRSDNAPTLINDVQRSAWLPATGAHSNGQFNPGVGVAVDAFAGEKPGKPWAQNMTVKGIGSIRSNGGNYYRAAAVAGPTAGAGAGPTGTGAGIVDGGVTWDYLGTVAGMANPAYPDVAYPRPAAPYNKPFSSQVAIEGCPVSGFSAGFAIQPCDEDGNGDFVRLNYCSSNECIIGISICNGQARNDEIRNHNYAHVHTFIANNQHGLKRGKLGGPIDNASGGQSLQVFDLNMGFAGAVRFTNHYGEGIWRWGDAIGAGTIEHHGDIQFAGATATGMFPVRGLPRVAFGTRESPTLAEGGGLTDTRLVLRGAIQMPPVHVLATRSLDTEGLTISTIGRTSEDLSAKKYQAQAQNALGGGLFAASSPFEIDNIRLGGIFMRYDVTTGLATGRTGWDGITYHGAKRANGAPLRALFLRSQQSRTPVPVPAEPINFGHAALTAKNLTGTTFTFTVAGKGASYQRYNLGEGDIIWHQASGALFVIKARAGDNITAELQNGYLDTTGTISFPQGAPNLAEGEFFFYTGRNYLPDYPIFADAAAGSATLTNVGTAEGSFGNSGDFADGDALAVDPQEDFVFTAAQTVTSRNAGAFTITLSANCAAAAAKRRLMFKRAA